MIGLSSARFIGLPRRASRPAVLRLVKAETETQGALASFAAALAPGLSIAGVPAGMPGKPTVKALTSSKSSDHLGAKARLKPLQGR
jgi:hypothetical protein